MKSITCDLGTQFLTATLTYLPPSDAPCAGADWSEAIDYPGVRLTIETTSSLLHASLRSPALLSGERMTASWGTDRGAGTRSLYDNFYAASLDEAEALARVKIAEARQTISQVVDARRLRLAMRDATIAAAHARHGEITDTDE